MNVSKGKSELTAATFVIAYFLLECIFVHDKFQLKSHKITIVFLKAQ